MAPVDPRTAEGPTRDLLGAVKSKMGRIPNLMKTMAQSPAVLEGYLSLSSALSRGVLPGVVREQIALAVGQENGCEYCLSAHALTGKLAGLTPEQTVDARRGESDDPRQQAFLDLALSLVETRGDLSDAQFTAARDAGLNDTEIAEVVGHVALNVLTNYFNQMARTEVDFPHVPLELPQREPLFV
jgi:uncharacterized peroxidase-related enzyme